MWSVLAGALSLLTPFVDFPNHLFGGSVLRHGRYYGPFNNGGVWLGGFEMAKNATAHMTLYEKVNVTSAFPGPCQANSGSVPRLGIPGLCFNDGPAGPRYTDFVTQWPSAFTAAASFDRALVLERARRVGAEFRAKGINVVLGPVTGGPLGRSPFAGRNWEAISPDMYLSSSMAYLAVEGMQESGLITCAKHFVAYEQEPVCTGGIDSEGGRMGCIYTSSEVDGESTIWMDGG
jgi:beta-glucosidase